ncbi:MAG: recombinase family protein [Pseudohongiellaceae bacterium]
MLKCAALGRLADRSPTPSAGPSRSASEALAAAKAAGKGGAALRETVASNADAHAAALAPVITELQRQGHTSLRALARQLNARGMRTRRGGQWHVSTVRNLLGRLATQS